jgi:hypothetical protein
VKEQDVITAIRAVLDMESEALSKREIFAAFAMVGILISLPVGDESLPSKVSKWAYAFADEMLSGGTA